MRDYYLPGEAADHLGVDVRRVQQWADAGLLAHTTTPGGTRRYDRGDVQHFTPPPTRRRLSIRVTTPHGPLILRTPLLDDDQAEAMAPVLANLQWAADLALGITAAQPANAHRREAA